MKPEILISKLTFNEKRTHIDNVFAYELNGGKLTQGETQNRDWLVRKTLEGNQISSIKRNVKGKWYRSGNFKYDNALFSWGTGLPQNSIKHQTFVSYYHKEDQEYRERFENLFGDLVISKSVNDGDIDSDNSDEYIKQLIQKNYLNQTTVLVVLIGSKTKCRKHVDWEISGALNVKVGDRYAGILGLILPNNENYSTDIISEINIPKRLFANIDSGYAIVKKWTESRNEMQGYIEMAYNNRKDVELIINKQIPQMQENTCQ